MDYYGIYEAISHEWKRILRNNENPGEGHVNRL